MKILFATDMYFPTPGGISVVIHRLSHILVKNGHQVAIIAPSTSWRFHEEKEDDITIYRVQSILVHKFKNIRYAPTFIYQKEMKRIITDFAPDIIHIETFDAIASLTVTIAKKLNIPIVATCHIMPANISGALPLPPKMGIVIGNLYLKVMSQVFNKVDYVTAPTETGISILRTIGVKTPMEAISNGLDLKLFHKQKETEAFRRKYHLPSEKFILYVGRLDKEKCVDIFVAALQYCEPIPFRAVIAGTGELLEDLKEQVKTLHIEDKVTFLGILPEDELPMLYSLASMFVMPSTAELQSLVTMEAMGTGLPVIGANAGALPFLIKDEENGYLFEPNNPEDLGKKMKSLLENSDLREQMGNASLKIIQQHDLENIGKRFASLYERLIEQKKNANAVSSHPLLTVSDQD